MSTELERLRVAVDKAKTFVRNGCSAGFANQLDHVINSILSPPPEMEEVEVERFVLFFQDGTASMRVYTREEIQGYDAKGGTFKCVTHTTKHPKPQPVERTVSGAVEWDRACDGSVYPTGKDADFHWPELFGKRGTLTFTYTEDPK